MFTDNRKWTTKIAIYGMYSFHSYGWNQFKVIPVECTLCTRNLPKFLQRQTRVDNTADSADITQSKAANHHRLLSHVTLGLVECRKLTACAEIAEPFEPNTVLWTFHTIQPSSSILKYCSGAVMLRDSLVDSGAL